MDRTILLHSPVRLNDNSATANLYSPHKAMGMASTRMELFPRTKPLPTRLLHLRVDVVYVTVQTHRVYRLACPME